MPLYSDLGIYYAPHLTTPSYYSSPFLGPSSRTAGSLGLGLMPVPRLLPSRISSGYSPLLTSIPESGYSARRLPSTLDRSASPRVAAPRYLPPKPVHIDTADIDVSAARFTAQRRDRPDAPVGGDPARQATIKRGRTVVRLHTKKLMENPTLDTRRRMTPGEKLVQKFLILDKKEEEEKAARRKRIEELEERERVQAEIAKLQALAAKKAAADAEAPDSVPRDGTFAQDPETPSPSQNFPTIQGLTENAALDILLSAAEDTEEQVQGGEIVRTESTGTVKKRKIKDKDGTVKAAKKKTNKKDGVERSSTPEDSPATGDEMVEKSTLQRRNTIRFRRNSDVPEGFPEIESVPGSRRSSFDQSPSSRRSSMDSTGDEIPLASEKKSTVKRRKGPKHKFVADVSIDDTTSAEPRSPKFVVEEVKVEQSPASPRGAPKKFRYEVIVEDVEAESAARRAKSGKENKVEAVVKKKKAKAAPGKPLADRQEKSAPKLEKDVEKAAEVKAETTPKSFQKSRLDSAEETKAQVAVKTDEITGKITQQTNKGKITQDVITPKVVTQDMNKESKPAVVDDTRKTTESETQDTKYDKKEQVNQSLLKDKKPLKEPESPKLVAKDNQKGFSAVKPKPLTLGAVSPKVEDTKVSKQVTEKLKTAKHQADPTPPPTPTIQKSDSGINFWDFLNGLEEEKEVKKPTLSKEEPLIQPEANKNEKPKGTKVKPALTLNIQNKCIPNEKIPETADVDTKKTLFGKKINEKPAVKTSEEKKANFSRKTTDLSASLDAIQPAISSVTTHKETPLDQESMKFMPIAVQEAVQVAVQVHPIATKPKSEKDSSKDTQKVGASAKTPDEKIPKWKIPAKDGAKTTAVAQSATGKSETENKEDTLMSPISISDENKPKDLVKETPDTPAAAIPKVPETPEKKPVPKWKGFGKQPPSPAPPKEAYLPKTAATPEPKNADMKLKSQVSEASDISTKVPSPTRDAADGVEKSPTSAVAPDTPKITEQNQTAKSPLGGQQKESSAADDPLKKKLLKIQDSKDCKVSKISTPEEDSKPVPKWKVKAQAEKDAELKKTPLGKIKQTSSDKSLASTESKPEILPEQLKNTTLSEPSTPMTEKDAVKAPSAANAEGKIPKTEPTTPIDIDKPPKKPLAKNKVATKLQETTPKETELSRQTGNDQKKPASPPETSVDSVTTKSLNEAELKTEATEKVKDKVPLGKAKLEQKSKEDEKDARSPFLMKVKVPEDKAPDKKEEVKAQTSAAKKGLNLTAQKSKDEEKPQQKIEDTSDKKSEPTTPVKKGANLVGQKNKEDKPVPQSPLTKAKPLAQLSKQESEPISPVKKEEKLQTQKSDDSEDGKKETTTAAKKAPKVVTQKSKDDGKSELQSPLKKGAKLIAQKSNEEKDESPSSPLKKTGKVPDQKSKEDTNEPSSPVKKVPKLPAQKSKDEEKTEPSSPVKKLGKLVAQKSKEDEEKTEPSSPVKKLGKLVAQKSKEDEEKTEASSPVKKLGKPVAQKGKEDEKNETPAAAKKGVKLVAQKSKEDTSETSTDAKTTTVPAKTKPKSAKKMGEATATATTPKARAAPATLPPPTPPATESGSDADSEDSSSSEDEDTTPRASSSSCSSSDSGFDSRPSSVPVPSTASSEASSRDAGSPSLALAHALDPYSEDAGLLRAAASGRTTPPAHSLPRYRKYTVDDFQFLKLLGKGSFGKVLLAELRGTDRYYAVKCLKKDVVLEDDDVECTLIERKVLALGTKHPYLCHLFCTFQTESHLLFVMEYLNGGDLMFHIQQSGRFPEPRARFYAAEIVSGLKFLHKKGIVYRDLKLDNILLDYEGHVRIADFGMCKLQIFLDRTADTFCGTPDYMAPEIIKGLKYNQCVDWWSFGVLVFEMLVGVSPFTGCDEDELFWSICNEQPQYPRFLSREAHSLLQALMEKDAQKRLGTPASPKGDVPDHIFFRNVDWDALERRELDPPFRPRVKHPLDVQYFDAAFTAERAELTPVDASILQSMDQAQFQGFSYTNPNATD